MKLWVGTLLALTLAACSGGGTAIPRAPGGGGGGPGPTKITVKFKVAVPSVKHARRGKHARHLSPRLKRVWSIAENTAGIKVVAYAHGDRTTALGTVVADISAATTPANGCTNDVNGDGGRSCSFALQAPPGNDDFVATTYDNVSCTAGGVCTIPTGAHQLAYGVATQTISAGVSNPTVSMALDGVLSKIQLALTPSALHTLIPSTATLSVYGLDADGDVIIPSSSFIDANGNSVTVSFTLSDTLKVGGTDSLSLAPASISTPPPSGIALTYAPQKNGFVASPPPGGVIITASSSATANATVSLSAIAPKFLPLADSNLNVNNPYHGGIAFDNAAQGQDNVYFTTPGGSNNQGSVDECTNCVVSPAFSSLAGTLAAPIRGGIAGDGLGGGLGTSSLIYAVAGTQGETVNNLSPVSFGPSAGFPNGSGMAYDSSGPGIWYTSGTDLVEITSSAVQPVPIGVNTSGGVTIDASGNVWTIDTVNNAIIPCGLPSPCTNTSVRTPISLQPGGAPLDALAIGTNVFVTDHQSTNPAILKVNSSGIASTVPLPSAAPWYLMPDTVTPTGIVWFDFLSNGQIGIGRMDVSTSTPTFLMATASSLSPQCGVLTNSRPGAIGTGPSGTVYMVFDDAGCIVRVQR